MTSSVHLLNDLIELQHKQSDREFARRLGVSNGLWSSIKRGDIPLNRKVLRGVVAAYPHLRDKVEAYWVNFLSASEKVESA